MWEKKPKTLKKKWKSEIKIIFLTKMEIWNKSTLSDKNGNLEQKKLFLTKMDISNKTKTL